MAKRRAKRIRRELTPAEKQRWDKAKREAESQKGRFLPPAVVLRPRGNG